MMSKSQRRFTRDAGILALGVMFTVPAVAIDTTPTWNPPEFVDNINIYFLNFDLYEGQDRYLAFDNYGEPAIAYSSVLGLRYARRTPGLGWSVNTTPDDTDPDGIYNAIAQPTLAFDLAEEPHLSYAGNNQADDYRVSHVSFDSGLPDWVHQNLWNASTQALDKMSTAMAVNQLNRADVVFQSVSLGMRFMKWPCSSPLASTPPTTTGVPASSPAMLPSPAGITVKGRLKH